MPTRGCSSRRSPRPPAAGRKCSSRPRCRACSTATLGAPPRNCARRRRIEVLAACREAAKHHRIWLHLGSLAVLVQDGKIANRGFVIDREGQVRARYDKIHLFDVDLPTGESWRESNVYSPGNEAVLVSGTPVGKLGLTICYDLRFPGLFARIAEADADVISVPAAFTVPTGRRTGMFCFVRGRSRRGCSSSPRRRSAVTRTAGKHSGIHSSSILGASAARHGRGEGRRLCRNRPGRGFPTCAREYRRLTTAVLSPRR